MKERGFICQNCHMPEIDRPTSNPKPFRHQLASLRADLGAWCWPAVALGVITAGAMLWGQGAGRQVYFTLSFFHVGLEASGLIALFRPRVALASSMSGACP